MRVHRAEIQLCLRFTTEEVEVMSPSFAFGDAEEQLSYAVHSFGSQRVADLIVAANNHDIGRLALTEVDGFTSADTQRIREMCQAPDPHVLPLRRSLRSDNQ